MPFNRETAELARLLVREHGAAAVTIARTAAHKHRADGDTSAETLWSTAAEAARLLLAGEHVVER